MPAPVGNKFWEARSKHGRNPIFTDPDKLWGACTEYFEWTEDNPLTEEKLFAYQGDITRATVNKIRAMTISSICLFLDISEDTWARYRGNKDLCGVITQAEKIIYNQKFTGAAADLLNANIIARDLGLRDGTDNRHSGPDGKPLTEPSDPKEVAKALAFLLRKGKQ